MLAQVLTHELQHASDHKAGRYVTLIEDNSFLREIAASRVERRFLTWLSANLGLLPHPTQVAQRLSADDWARYGDTYTWMTSGDVGLSVIERYLPHCSNSPLR